jgi:hypothetical protein
MSSIYILWDASHIWGLLAWRTAQSLDLPYRLVRGEEIAQGLLSGKPPALLLVPGGNARMKSVALGAAGMQAIRDYVRGGGAYVGFCGGAGLGLSGSEGLGLCPWGRARFTDRMQHFVSGHVHARVARGHDLVPADLCTDACAEPPVPIWWPGRFAPEKTGDVEVLATYTTPCDDFWVADLPLDTLPPGTFSEWESLYDIRLRPTFLEDQPCILSGRYGKGRYVLSYTHLETPDSPTANRWLLHIIRTLGGIEPAGRMARPRPAACPRHLRRHCHHRTQPLSVFQTQRMAYRLACGHTRRKPQQPVCRCGHSSIQPAHRRMHCILAGTAAAVHAQAGPVP